jgi:hypothetical protein
VDYLSDSGSAITFAIRQTPQEKQKQKNRQTNNVGKWHIERRKKQPTRRRKAEIEKIRNAKNTG